jgi:nitrate/TMAO reductase-like tetraheme cytochrome c subunit
MKRLMLLVLFVASAATAQQSPHGNIKLACETCHSTDSWTLRTDAAFNHNSTGFALEGRHQSVACRSCHENLVFTSKSPDCASCHTDVHKNELGTNCVRCHSSDGWVVPDMRAKHEGTRFPLLGRHGLISCDDCHARETSSRFAGTPVACIACHKKEYDATTAPNHVAAGFGVECMTCHRVNDLSWPGGFDHNLTSFPLTGIHQTIPCSDCHKNNAFDRLSVNCYDCHKADFENSQSPNHVAGGFSQQCATCHTTAAWRPAAFDHNATRFPLTGKHTGLECQTCHTNGNYQLTYTDCYQCHSSEFNGVSSPNHVAGNFSHYCLTCHTTSAWNPATFSHAATNFPLTGAHTSTTCQSCHTNGNYQLTYADCYQCHQGDFSQTTNPSHASGNFSHACLTCHTTAAWQPASFDHTPTQFPLTGAHTTIQCASCHVNGNYQLAYANCYQCHKPQFDATTNPNHVTQNISQNCVTCHSTTAWQPASFDHAATQFPLTGAHTAILCASCHVNGNYQLAYADCYQCHKPDFDAAAAPNHVTQGFSHNCLTCHTTSVWQPSTFDHAATQFPLTGAHTTIQCSSCHVGGNYQLAYVNCYQCHKPEFDATTNPNHVTQNISQNCVTCHTTTAWQPASFDHSQTQFPLTGAHTAVICSSCHINGNYQLAYTSCYQCHQPDFVATTNPNHVTQNFSQNCLTCHTTAAWSPAAFDHSTTRFSLTGAHTTILCASCHINGNYQLAYTDCYQCHKTAYEQPTDPNHVLPNFDHDCTPCHTTTSWIPTTFKHDELYFKIYSGRHVGYWSTCATCHGDPANYASFTCFNCHTHDQTVTDGHHVSIAGYSYTSAACYNCHRGV